MDRKHRSPFVLLLALSLVIAAFCPRVSGGKPPAVVASISGGGIANMDDGEGRSSWGLEVQLFSDGSASGFFDCVDQQGDFFPGNFFGPVTSWSRNPDGTINLHGVA